MTILLIVLSILGTGAAAFAGMILASLLAHVMGRGRFVEEGLDGGSFIVTSMFLGGFAVITAPVFAAARAKVHHVPPPPTSPWLYVIVPALALVVVTLCGFFWLALLSFTHRHTEFHIEADGTIRGKRKEILSPTAVQQNADYHETSMANGYVVYNLTLLSGAEKRATNSYMSEEVRDAMLTQLLALGRTPPCRSLDLTLVCRRSRLTWLQVALSPQWTPFLAQPEQFLPEEAVAFWRSLTLPDFSSRARRTISRTELRQRIAELESLLSSRSESPDSLYSNWKLLTAFAQLVKGPVIAVTHKGFEEMTVEAVGRPAHATYGDGEGNERRFLVTLDRQDGKSVEEEKAPDLPEVG